MRFIPYGWHYIDGEDIGAVVEVLRSGYLTQGPKLSEFERALAQYCGARFAVCFSSGTAALHAAYFALGLGEGDKFITTPITFAATANAGLYLGARPIFVDVEPDTGNIHPDLIEGALTDDCRLISVVHYAGHPVDMERIWSIARRYNLKVVEDACHALGARYRGEPVGCCRYSDAAVFSFHPVKHITTAEGGAVLTNNEEVYEKLLLFRNHGITRNTKRFLYPSHGPWYYEMQFLGYNYRMNELSAALGISQLRKLDLFVRRRREIASYYSEALSDLKGVMLPVERDYAKSSYHLYVLRLRGDFAHRKGEIFSRLREMGLGVQVHYIPVYLHPHYRRLGYTPGLCPAAEDFYRRVLSIPIYPAMSDDDLFYVVDCLRKVL